MSNLFDAVRHQEGLRPAVDPGISVSRIGQLLKVIYESSAGALKLKLAHIAKLRFCAFCLDLDAVTKKVLQEVYV